MYPDVIKDELWKRLTAVLAGIDVSDEELAILRERLMARLEQGRSAGVHMGAPRAT